MELNAIFLRSPNGVFCGSIASSLLTGKLSPVSEDSSIFKEALSIILKSVGTESPASSMIISPTTISSLFTFSISPFLNTLANGLFIFLSSSIDLSAFCSCMTPIIELMITINKIIPPSINSR